MHSYLGTVFFECATEEPDKELVEFGYKVENLEIIKIVLPVEGLEKAVFEMNGLKYMSFEVAKLRVEDKFGRTHTAQ